MQLRVREVSKNYEPADGLAFLTERGYKAVGKQCIMEPGDGWHRGRQAPGGLRLKYEKINEI
jgi:hypothetical protein